MNVKVLVFCNTDEEYRVSEQMRVMRDCSKVGHAPVTSSFLKITRQPSPHRGSSFGVNRHAYKL